MELESQSIESVSQESSPSTPTESSAPTQNQSTSESASAAPESKSNSDSNTPFHEHPRWKELIEQRNQFQTQMQEMQKQLRDYQEKTAQAAQPKEPTTEEKVIAELEKVHPDFANLLKSMQARLPKVDQLEQQWQAREAEQVRQNVQTQLSSLHQQYKVPQEHQDLYKSLIKSRATESNAQAADLPKIYKSVHDDMAKILDSVKRSERESYVTAKKADSSVPTSQSRGTPAKASAPKKPEFSADPDEARRQVVSRVVQSLRASKNTA